MSKKETYERRTEELLLPIVEAEGLEIYDVEYVKEGAEMVLRITIDQDAGIGIEDCERLHRAIDPDAGRKRTPLKIPTGWRFLLPVWNAPCPDLSIFKSVLASRLRFGCMLLWTGRRKLSAP